MATNSVVQDSRKRTLEALERRFAVAKAELLLHQKKSKKILIDEDGKMPPISNSSTTDAPVHSKKVAKDGSDSPSLSSSKRGNFTFSGHATLQDVEEGGLTYMQLSQSLHECLITDPKSSSRKESSVDKVLHELLQKGDSAHKYMQGSRSMKIDNWILLDNYVQGRGVSSGSHNRALRIHSKRSKKHMSIKQHKKHGSFDLPQESKKFNTFKPMHEMWKDYMMQLLKTAGKSQLAQILLDADLHGAIILVVECKVTSFTGVSGIMIRETAETFGIITEDDRFRVVPKKVSVFVFQVNGWKVTLHGDKLRSRNLGL
ncbi:Ribonuclease P protein subunit p29 [Quillaja saponaria]|uniref:Ribonuclease P protein subunit p29 n=1 Tax=Quillaja saponaria TaxID=32244 RepID=A0AAD7QJJ3_QUISA|nr:Ribonuclease P protein subunit p29 [Quillaja saponaria]KAJ7982699.1 Ribonuclease P protein subunit p29 [Quillaja saponaria]